MKEYVIKAGDNFYLIAQRYGCNWQQIVECNPRVDPCGLQIGQRILLPISIEREKQSPRPEMNHEKWGNTRYDDVFVEVEGVQLKVTRRGETQIPHELHLIIPRTEIRKVEHPVNGVIETSIMLSNINIVNSPRLAGESGVPQPKSQEKDKNSVEES